MYYCVNAAMMGVVVSNDLWYMHLYADGEDFDKSHELTLMYYKKLSEDVDYLMELAVELGESVPNPSSALEYVSNYEIESRTESYSYHDIVVNCYSKILRFVKCLQEFRNQTSRFDVQSYLDDLIRFWKKELDYKLIRRSAVI